MVSGLGVSVWSFQFTGLDAVSDRRLQHAVVVDRRHAPADRLYRAAVEHPLGQFRRTECSSNFGSSLRAHKKLLSGFETKKEFKVDLDPKARHDASLDIFPGLERRPQSFSRWTDNLKIRRYVDPGEDLDVVK